MRALLPLSILPSLVLAVTPPSCPATAASYQEEKLFFLYRTFCHKLSAQSFASQLSFTGSATDPWVSLGFEPVAGGSCSEDVCAGDFGTLVDSCKKENHTVFGGGNVGTGCGSYNFTIYAQGFQPGQDGTEKPLSILDVNPTGSAISSIEAALTSSFGLTATKKVVSVTESSTSSSSSSSSTSSSSSVQSTTSTAESTSTSTAPTTTSLSSVVMVTGTVANETITTSGPFGNSTVVVLTTSGTFVGPVTSVLKTTGTPGVGGSTVTGAPASPSSTNVNSRGSVIGVAGWRLAMVGLFALLF
ncbi:hypothetical protein GLAREA_07674 [Glarea lozoyensis ATCC 20868]|uniref:Uncharacterized protein n=1 Tax=Glarea lozoyensis (strain ATCC 20868 / MF5171) TaxID=1116229 RepID=S3D401_GLAL2|nr:uncharacterized protein GLAREA_07674 [Glarea lozoyensis ATCC 20868]EPE32540.1 hypothetical protein GLAREA_07674 [Glarea lozoyensis ATCC 20868]